MTHRSSRLFLGFCFLAVLLPCAASEYPTETWRAWLEGTTGRYPGETWLEYAAPEEAGWSAEGLRKAREYFQKIDSAAVMVIHDGAILAAWGDVDRRYMCHSVRKSFLSALYGIHVANGKIDPARTLAALKIDDEPPLTEAEKQARVIDLLASRSGIYHPAAYETLKMKTMRPERGRHGPGELFWYNNWDFNALCTILEQEIGGSIFAGFQNHIAVPLQMEDFRLQDTYYHLEKEHSIHPAYPFRMSARDMARFGVLFLRRGKWRDRRILTEQWVKESTSAHSVEPDRAPDRPYGYGYMWWRIVDGPFKELEMFSARGYGGHSIDVVPVADLVFVHRVNTFWDMDPPFGSKRDRVSDPQRLALLDLILKAREAAPRRTAKLIPALPSGRSVAAVKLDGDLLARYAGEYRFEGFRLRLGAADGRLWLSGPAMGRFSLRPLSATEFVIEDVEAPAVLELDDRGHPRGLSIEFAPGRKRRGERVLP